LEWFIIFRFDVKSATANRFCNTAAGHGRQYYGKSKWQVISGVIHTAETITR